MDLQALVFLISQSLQLRFPSFDRIPGAQVEKLSCRIQVTSSVKCQLPNRFCGPFLKSLQRELTDTA